MQASSNPRGAVYLPSRAYNPYQQWAEYSREETERDFGYACSLGLDSLRLWISYEYWLEAPEELAGKWEHLLDLAESKGLQIMPSLFDSCGRENTPEALRDKNPKTAACVVSPAWSTHRDESLWEGPARFVRWFMERYADEARLLAIEVINEPYLPDRRMEFARAMFRIAAGLRKSVPLTVGCANMEENLYFFEMGLDILQFHINFPSQIEPFRKALENARAGAALLARPIWLTEWQRQRKGTSGWDGIPFEGKEWEPDYASLADIVRETGIGNFFWSLMVKPAYLPPQRQAGTVNGVFHEDGAVWNLADARALSGRADFFAKERPETPKWFIAAP
ncbi:MAG: glycoside hydrolase [Candidatus Sumerlaeia bacterium]